MENKFITTIFDKISKILLAICIVLSILVFINNYPINIMLMIIFYGKIAITSSLFTEAASFYFSKKYELATDSFIFGLMFLIALLVNIFASNN